MKNRKFAYLLFVIGFIGSINGRTQSAETLPEFPKAWLGTWKGTLQIFQGQNVVQQVNMVVENAPTDSTDIYTWALIYGDDPVKGRRDYKLKPKDKVKGIWVTDEQNSIFLEGKVMANTYISVFEVAGNILTSKMTLVDEETMEFEILVFKSEVFQSSGNSIHEGEDIPEVKSYPLQGFQRAILTKEK